MSTFPPRRGARLLAAHGLTTAKFNTAQLFIPQIPTSSRYFVASSQYQIGLLVSLTYSGPLSAERKADPPPP